jgi:hypothetical protein
VSLEEALAAETDTASEVAEAAATVSAAAAESAGGGSPGTDHVDATGAHADSASELAEDATAAGGDSAVVAPDRLGEGQTKLETLCRVRSVFETKLLSEILHENLVRTLKDAEACLERLKREYLR